MTLKARNEHGDWITRDAAIGIWTSDLQRALHAFTRPSQYGAAVLAIFGLGTGKRSVHFDWIGTSLAALSSNLPEIHSASSFPNRHELSADLLAIVYSWMVQDPYDVFQDATLQSTTSPRGEQYGTPRSGNSTPLFPGIESNSAIKSYGQRNEKNYAFKALQSWAANKFSAAASKVVVGTGGMKTLVSCFHASSPQDPASIAITLISPHQEWPLADDHTIKDWMKNACIRVKSIASKNTAARIKGSVILYMPSLVGTARNKLWKPSAPEFKKCYEDFCGPSNVSFVCMSPWEVLEVSEYLRSSVLESSITREDVTEIWAHCLPALNPVRGVQESIYDQRDEAKFFSYGWPDISRSHVPRVQAVALCASSVVRSVLTGCHYLTNNEDMLDGREQNLSHCFFDTVSVSFFDEVSTFCRQLHEGLVSSHAASAKDVVLLVLEFFLELFEGIMNVLEDPDIPDQRIRKLILDANVVELDVDTVLSSSDYLSQTTDAIQILAEAFGEGRKQLMNARKAETLDQCEAIAKCTISIVNSVLKGPVSHLSPNRRWRDDELWKQVSASPGSLTDTIPFRSHCQAISEFITTASFCGTEKNVAFPNGRFLDSAYHRSVAFQCIETLLFFVCNTVMRATSSCGESLLRPLRFLCRSKSGNKGIRDTIAEITQRFQVAISRLKKLMPQKSPPPPTQMKPPVPKATENVLLTPHRRRSLNASGQSRCIDSESLVADASIFSDQHKIAPGLRVLHDVQTFEHSDTFVSGVLSEDCRFVLIFGLFVDERSSSTLLMRMIAGLIENLSSRWKPSFLGLLHFLKILVLNVFELTRMKPVQF